MNDKFTEFMLLIVNKVKLEGLFSNTYKSYKLIRNNDKIDSINDKYRDLLDDLKKNVHQNNQKEWENFILILDNIDLRVKTIYSKKILEKFLELYNSLDKDTQLSFTKKIAPQIIKLMITNDYYESVLLSDIVLSFSEMKVNDDEIIDLIYFIYKNNLFKEILKNKTIFFNILFYLENTTFLDNFINHYNEQELYSILQSRKFVRSTDMYLMNKIPFSNYELNADRPISFYNNIEYFKYWIIERGYDINLIELYKGNENDDDFLIELLNRGYIINRKSPSIFFSHVQVLEYAIINKKQDINIIKYFSDPISDKLAIYLLEHNYDFNSKIRNCSEYFCKYYYEKVFKTDRLDKFIKSKLNIVDPYYHLTSFLVEIGDITKFDVLDEEMFDILQYMYFAPHKDHGFQYVVREKKIDRALKAFKLIVSEWDIKKFIDFVSSYIINERICEIVIENEDKIDNDNIKYDLMRILIYGNRTYIASFDDIINYKNKRYEINQGTINFGSIDNFKDVILKNLFNLDSYEAKKLIFEFHISKNLDNLIDSIHNPKYIDILKEYQLILKFISSIMSCNDSEVLKKIANTINELYKANNLDKLDSIWNLFKEIKEELRYILGKEINEKIIDFDEMLLTEKNNVPKDSRSKSLYRRKKITIKKDLSYKDSKFNKGTELDYIELTGIPFVMFGHVLNAFGNGGDIDLFKRSHLEGKPYICLSAISDTHYRLVEEDEVNVQDSPRLLFTKLPSKQFVMGSNCDLNSSGDDFDIKTIGNPNFNPVRYNISNTRLYNEYIYYRKGLYPSAVLIKDPKPKEHELIAALHLGIPLVYINPKYYPKGLPSESFKKDDELYNYYEDIYINKRKKKIEKDILEMKSLREFIETLYFKESDVKEVIKC